MKLAKTRDDHSKIENKLKVEKLGSENTLTELINSYDSEMVRLHTARNEKQKNLKKLSDQLNNLKRHFQEIEEERKR